MRQEVKNRHRGQTTVSSKHQVTLPVTRWRVPGWDPATCWRSGRGPGELLLGGWRPGRALRGRADRGVGARLPRWAARRVALTVLDAGVIIAVLDGRDAHHAAADDAVRGRRGRRRRRRAGVGVRGVCGAPLRRRPEAATIVDDLLDAGWRGSPRSPGQQRGPRPSSAPTTVAVAAAGRARPRDGPGPGGGRVLTTDARWPALRVPVEVVAGLSVGDARRHARRDRLNVALASDGQHRRQRRSGAMTTRLPGFASLSGARRGPFGPIFVRAVSFGTERHPGRAMVSGRAPTSGPTATGRGMTWNRCRAWRASTRDRTCWRQPRWRWRWLRSFVGGVAVGRLHLEGCLSGPARRGCQRDRVVAGRQVD